MRAMKLPPPSFFRPLVLFSLLCLSAHPAAAQHRLKALPEYERYQKAGAERWEAVKSGALSVKWLNGGAAFEYERDGRLWRYDIATKTATDAGPPPRRSDGDRAQQADRTRSAREWRERPERGRQFPAALSPDGELVAFHRNRNLYIGRAAGGREQAVTGDATEENRLRYGTASWVYGEELYQKTAIWWSTNGRRLAFYKFDESRVPDYYLALDQTKLQSALDVEPYAKAGAPNPKVDLLIYDLETKRTVTVDARDGKGFGDDVVGHYLFAVMWSPDGGELLFHRMDRRQQVLELCAANPDTGKCRVIFRDEWRTGWIDPELATLRFLKDGRRFLRETERTGWRNIELWSLSGDRIADLTAHEFETAGIVRVDEEANRIFYLARGGDNHMKLQLFRAPLDGEGESALLTDPAFHHDVDLAPDGRHFIDVAQTHDQPARTRLVDAETGEPVAELAASDMTKWTELGLKPVELFTFKSADGETELHGMLHFPSNFDETKKWPVLLSVYGGPGTNGARETFTVPSPDTELGWLVVNLDARTAGGRGKRFLDSVYRKLGVAEIDDLAAGIKALAERPYVDAGRVGVYGTSYGGTVSALCLLRHPDVFQAACASSGVMDFRNYDSIYTERYMGLPSENARGYDSGSPMTYVNNLKGSLMIFYGTADNNVHPSNSLQLIAALQRAGKSFDVQVGPDQGHVSLNRERMMEFFRGALGAGPK